MLEGSVSSFNIVMVTHIGLLSTLHTDYGASMMLTVSHSSTWAIDSKATNYMTNMRSEFMAYKHSTHASICVTDGNCYGQRSPSLLSSQNCDRALALTIKHVSYHQLVLG